MRTAARRVGQAAATAALAGVELVEAPRALFTEAGLLPVPGLRSLDALHLATALPEEASVLVAYDHPLLQGRVGPGRADGLAHLSHARGWACW